MPDPQTPYTPTCPENLIPLFQADLPNLAGKDRPEAFLIHTPEVFYLSVLFDHPERGVHGHGYAAFTNGEKVNFSIAANGDLSVRERCIQAGEQVARAFGTALACGTIDAQGRFIPDRPARG